MEGSNSHIEILTLNVNGLNAPNQKTQTGKLDKKPKSIGVLYPGNPSHMQGYPEAQNKGMKIYQANGEQKKRARVAILVSYKIDFKPTKIKRNKEGHYIMVKESM